ncbi:alpha/beta hydrolase [Lysobacter korlensis]|uniref:Alpha/beta hydrolase n=1 Tax=Lysobacter korlensis TaxID=553636 RepID=A0ABV6RS91_9GAMM
MPNTNAHTEGRLQARPKQVEQADDTGLQSLGYDPARDSYFYVPDGYRPDRPAPAVLLLHGAGGHAHHGLSLLRDLADAHGLVLIAPASRKGTWDVIAGGYGPDVALIDQALTTVFDRYSVDPQRLAIGGFSDGASYALSLGITNGDMFTHVLAFSPGFAAPADQRGAPAIYISHGTDDAVLPIEACSRVLAPRLERAGYRVRYREFSGGHVIPPDIAREAVDWFFDGTAEASGAS